MTTKIKTIKYGITHQIATCNNCSFREEGYQVARKAARKHATQTGHSVGVETGIHYDYVPANTFIDERQQQLPL